MVEAWLKYFAWPQTVTHLHGWEHLDWSFWQRTLKFHNILKSKAERCHNMISLIIPIVNTIWGQKSWYTGVGQNKLLATDVLGLGEGLNWRVLWRREVGGSDRNVGLTLSGSFSKLDSPRARNCSPLGTFGKTDKTTSGLYIEFHAPILLQNKH